MTYPRTICGYWQIKTKPMTPSEKAKALVDKYRDIIVGDDGDRNLRMDTDAAKEAATIAVDEILEVLASIYNADMGNRLQEKILLESITHYKSVKEEIQKL